MIPSFRTGDDRRRRSKTDWHRQHYWRGIICLAVQTRITWNDHLRWVEK
jgi:hypothetical protein